MGCAFRSRCVLRYLRSRRRLLTIPTKPRRECLSPRLAMMCWVRWRMREVSWAICHLRGTDILFMLSETVLDFGNFRLRQGIFFGFHFFLCLYCFRCGRDYTPACGKMYSPDNHSAQHDAFAPTVGATRSAHAG